MKVINPTTILWLQILGDEFPQSAVPPVRIGKYNKHGQTIKYADVIVPGHGIVSRYMFV